MPHGDHIDYLHDGHRHALHEGHYDEHFPTDATGGQTTAGPGQEGRR